MASEHITDLDDDQAAVLYSPFREKSLNPVSWNRKMKFWQNTIIETLSEQSKLSLDVQTLAAIFERRKMKPKCLSTVLEEMERNRQIKSIDDFNKSNGWISWGFNTLVKQPLSWGVNQLLGPSKHQPGVYVVPQLVQQKGEDVLQLLESHVHHWVTDSVMLYSDMRMLCHSLLPSDQDFQILLTHLEREKKICMKEIEEKEVLIKFCKRNDRSVEPISDLEISIHRIQKTQAKLDKEILLLSSRMDETLEEAKVHIRNKNKTLAMHSLRKKKNLVKTIEQKSSSLTKLQDILQSIQDAESNEMIMKACEAGLKSLRKLNQDMSLDKVEAVTDDLTEAVEEQGEISEAMGNMNFTPATDSELLEKELDELLKEDRLKGECSEKAVPDGELAETLASLMLDDIDLPDVPTHSPSSLKKPTRQEPVQKMFNS